MDGRAVKAKPMTPAERKRAGIIRAEIGCIACIIDGNRDPVPAYLHHCLDTGVRRGHMFSYGLCDEHHVGNDCSIHKTKRKFNAIYGTDDDLIAMTDELVAAHNKRWGIA